MRPIGDAVKIARHAVPGLRGERGMSPVGTTESVSIVPTGLIIILMHAPGTNVPGYFRGVPNGTPYEAESFFADTNAARVMACSPKR
jgi:hypothetical protein